MPIWGMYLKMDQTQPDYVFASTLLRLLWTENNNDNCRLLTGHTSDARHENTF
jgi:hypothetical protein